MLSRPGFSRLVFSAAAAAALFVQPLDSARVAAIPVVRAVSATAAPGDFDGDGRMDVAVKHDNGEWVIDFAANGLGFWDDLLPGYGGAEYVPAPADYDGDGKTDMSTKDIWGNWYIDFSSNGVGEWDWDAIYPGYGPEGAHPQPRDYDGDGRADLSVKTDWGEWHIDYAANGFGRWDRSLFGLGASEAVPADYDGDGKADLSLWDAGGNWYIDYARNGYQAPGIWEDGSESAGPADGHPVPADYDGDGKADMALKTDAGAWHIDYAANRFGRWDRSFAGYGAAYFRALPADYDGDNKADLVMRDDDGYWYVDYAGNGLVDWELIWNPEVVTLSDGRVVTAYDVRVFDATWMKPYDRYGGPGGVGWANYSFDKSFEGGVWATGERMAALARMYELTRAPRYLQQLSELVQIVLANRDDRRADRATRSDGLRGNRLMAAWGARNVSYGNYHSSSIVVAAVYAYPIAAFARIVAESPELQGAYGVQAKDAATAMIETMQSFLPELKTESLRGGSENYFVNPSSYATLLTSSRCQQAYEAAMKEENPDVDALGKEKSACNARRKVSGMAMAHNENHAMVMALIELSRALDSAFYRTGLSAERAAFVRAVARTTIPRIVARAQRYFANNWRVKATSLTKVWYIWDYADIDVSRHLEDPSHGGVSMGYMRLLLRDKTRLDDLAAAASESIPLSPEQIRLLTNTFVFGVGRLANLAKNVGGGVADPIDKYNATCEGWLKLSQFDVRVFDKCEAVTLRQVNRYARPTQPYLSMAGHAALLEMKGYRRE